MLEYPLHGRLHSFLLLKRKCLLSGNNKQWHGWLQRNSDKGVAEVSSLARAPNQLLARALSVKSDQSCPVDALKLCFVLLISFACTCKLHMHLLASQLAKHSIV